MLVIQSSGPILLSAYIILLAMSPGFKPSGMRINSKHFQPGPLIWKEDVGSNGLFTYCTKRIRTCQVRRRTPASTSRQQTRALVQPILLKGHNDIKLLEMEN